MTDNKITQQVNEANAEEMCRKISGEANQQVQNIIGRAQQEADKILRSGRQAAEEKKAILLKTAERDLEKLKDRIFSTINLEKKRVTLAEKNNFIEEIMREVRALAEGFRNSKDYAGYLKKAVLEGVKVVDNEYVEVLYAAPDEKLFNENLHREIVAASQSRGKKNITLDFQKSSFSDPGVMVQSKDGHLMYDNRFKARLARMQEEIYMELMKESF